MKENKALINGLRSLGDAQPPLAIAKFKGFALKIGIPKKTNAKCHYDYVRITALLPIPDTLKPLLQPKQPRPPEAPDALFTTASVTKGTVDLGQEAANPLHRAKQASAQLQADVEAQEDTLRLGAGMAGLTVSRPAYMQVEEVSDPSSVEPSASHLQVLYAPVYVLSPSGGEVRPIRAPGALYRVGEVAGGAGGTGRAITYRQAGVSEQEGALHGYGDAGEAVANEARTLAALPPSQQPLAVAQLHGWSLGQAAQSATLLGKFAKVGCDYVRLVKVLPVPASRREALASSTPALAGLVWWDRGDGGGTHDAAL